MEQNAFANFPNEDIKSLIYTIREKQVMLDSDVAMLYHYPTKRINETVNRNKQRFPENFCFQLTEEEIKNLKRQTTVLNLKQENNWSQIATSSKNANSKHRGKKYIPYVFTEQGIAMLSGLLKNDIAIQLTKKKKHVEVVILTSGKSNIENLDIQKFNKEYPVLKVFRTNKFHDRFIVIDNKEMYHLGASIKDLGKKCFGINKIEDMEIIEKIINCIS